MISGIAVGTSVFGSPVDVGRKVGEPLGADDSAWVGEHVGGFVSPAFVGRAVGLDVLILVL